MLLASAVMATGAEASQALAASEQVNSEPRLVAWSNDEVKAYYNSKVDWSIPTTEFTESDVAEGQGGDSVGGDGGTTIVHNSGFGWESMLLYGLLMSRG